MTGNKMLVTLSLGLFVGFLLTFNSGMAKDSEFVGVKGCAKCHKKEKVGAQTAKWEKSEHAKAFEVLKSDEAMAAAKKVGVTGKPSESPECLVCHTTAFGVDDKLIGKKFKVEEGVQCEGCHGPGSQYDSKKVKKALSKLKESLSKKPGDAGLMAKVEAERAKLNKEVGLMIPGEKFCKGCHAAERTLNGKTYKNPSWDPKKGFDYKERLKEIAHPTKY
ncbi:MAG: cytochrome c family protein [SAR324 cluster bacterium]|nr:cytochrome c family protein [SAR324 cluster bacterium]